MVNIYAAQRGGIVRIDGHGVATFEIPCDVPEHVAAELCASVEFAREQTTDERHGGTGPTPQPVEQPVALAYHARRGKVHHVRPDCSVANNTEPMGRRLDGDGGLPLCSECERLSAPESEA